MTGKFLKVILFVIFFLSMAALLLYYYTKRHTVVFIGDSITYYGETTESGFVQKERKKYSPKVNIIAKGICGDETSDILARIKPDMLDYKPDVMIMMIGINDINNKNILIDELKQNMAKIIDITKENNIEPMIINLSFITEDLNNSKNIEVEEYNKFLANLAKEKGFQLIDVHTPLKAEIEKHQNDGLVVMEDDLHLNDAGNTIVADEIIKEFDKKYKFKWFLF